jgi:phosphatidylserine decarboxylase
MRIREEALPFAAPILALAGLFLLVQGWVPAGACAVLALAVCLFFRDPQREPPLDPTLLVSPADGRILLVGEDSGRLKISVFMSVFNVHVNRAPCSATVASIAYNPGKFMAAYAEKASLDNEQNRVRLRTDHGEVEVVQIAGLVARRIVCWVGPGDRVERAGRIGLIRFGSRVDLYLPAGAAKPLVEPGQTVRAGTTPLARWEGGS